MATSTGPVATSVSSTISNAISTSLSSAISATVFPSSSSTSPPPPPSAPSASPSNTSTPAPQGGPQSSPLLFFVALGFGVVFTNLWIIVGVKYCFRYSARNRQPRDENGDPIDMGAMPRQHRRRREKKLMTMEEVNERFPITKYKTWTANRAEQGLPAAGGINTDATSIKNEAGTIDESRPSVDPARPSTAASRHKENEETHQTSDAPATNAPAADNVTPLPAPPPAVHLPKADDDDDEAIQMAVPQEMLNAPGDSCAICIDTLEEDDDVRGLTCGHAFHASCVDPWLTSRRACCPLCKADYYVPKPRPEGEQAEAERDHRRGSATRRAEMMLPPATTFSILNGRMRPRPHPNTHALPIHAAPRFPRFGRRRRESDPPRGELTNPPPPQQQPMASGAVENGRTRRWHRSMDAPPLPTVRLPRFNWRRGRNNTDAEPTQTELTPRQVEDGTVR